MKKVTIESFQVIGIAIRTTNEKAKSANEIGELWNKFISENSIEKIPNKIDSTIYSIYTNYEGDHTQPYTTLLGCKVNSLDEIPEGMVGMSFNGGNYVQIPTKGDITKGYIYEEWLKIWKMNLNRSYTADFEVYGEKAQNPTNAEVDIFVAVKN